MVRILTGAVSVVATTLLLATTTAATAHTIETRVDTQKSAGFRASDGSVAFALNIPQNDTNGDLYFTMSGPSSQSWIAIGMGNDRMEDSLIFMAYASNNGTGITLSPRLSYGHIEPSYTPDVNFTLETGSGIANGNYTINAICTNCRAWKGMETDALNPTNTAAKFIFASGPSGSLNTNDMRVSLKRHGSFGAFTMNLNDAFGKRGMPIIQFADFGGSKETQDKKDNDFSSVLHGCMMILAFVGLMPMGILILRLLGSAKYHGWNQAASSAIAILGAFLGVYCGTTYNRSRSFNSAHQIFGLFITLAMIGQFILGFLHHRTYKKTLSPTKLSTPHIWLGRIVIPLGIANGFLGFPLALNSKYNWVLLALTLLVVLVMGPFAWWAWKRNERKNRPRMGVVQDESDGPGYQSQPWRTEVGGASQSDINLPSYGDGQSQGQMHPPLGGYQAPRGFA